MRRQASQAASAVDPAARPTEEVATAPDDHEQEPAIQDERADGGPMQRQAKAEQALVGLGAPPVWQQDPFALLAAGLPQPGGQAQAQPQSIVPPKPGAASAIGHTQMAREGARDFPDDMRCDVVLWEVNSAGSCGDMIMYAQNVLYSAVRNPLTWIEYGGKWHYEIREVDGKKVLLEKTVTTPGPDAPRTAAGGLAWRPAIGGNEMDESRLANALVLALRGVGAIPQSPVGLPAGIVPQGVYTDVSAQLRNDIGDLKAEIRGMKAELQAATRDLDTARRERDIAVSESAHLKEKVDELRQAVRDAKDGGSNGQKPIWAYAFEALKPRDDGVKATDLMALQREFTLSLDKVQRGGGTAEAIATFNAVVDMVGKVQKTAGGPSAAAGEDNLDRLLNIFDKGATIVERRQRMAEQAGPAQSKPGNQSEQATTARANGKPVNQERDALTVTFDRIVASFRRQEPEEKVARMLAAAIVWAGELDFAASDAEIRGFLSEILRDPEGTLTWYGSHQDPKVPDEYCKKLAAALRVALNQPAKAPATKTADGAETSHARPPQPTQEPAKPETRLQPPPAAEPDTAVSAPAASPAPDPAPVEPRPVPAAAATDPSAAPPAAPPPVS